METIRPIAIQLYTVREAMEQDLEGTLKRIAEMGFVGVETAGFHGKQPAEFARMLRDLDLSICSAHLAPPVGDSRNEALEAAAAMGVKRIVTSVGPDGFETIEKIHATCDMLSEAAQIAKENGLEFGYHNHWWEFERVSDRRPFQIMVDRCDPSLFFQIDVYWVQVGGVLPAQVIQEAGSRAPLLHIKDGPAVKGEPQTAVGAGKLQWERIFAASGAAQWMIVELDECATDMLEAVEQSYLYLTTCGFAYGKVEGEQ